MKPVLKWVGGKTQLLTEIRSAMPPRFDRYFEPFLGGGALFFELEAEGAVLSDLNPRLVSFYQCLAINPDALFDLIEQSGMAYDRLDEITQAVRYYEVRETFNSGTSSELEMASDFYFLNKTGFNGLFRENAQGSFNVPFGKKKKFSFPERTNFFEASRLLNASSLTHSSYEQSVRSARAGDFVYLDPPYVPLDGSPSFTAYLSSGFGPSEQERLAATFAELSSRGVLVMASNSFTPTVRHLYREFNVRAIKARRNINSVGKGRGAIDEALITNY